MFLQPCRKETIFGQHFRGFDMSKYLKLKTQQYNFDTDNKKHNISMCIVHCSGIEAKYVTMEIKLSVDNQDCTPESIIYIPTAKTKTEFIEGFISVVKKYFKRHNYMAESNIFDAIKNFLSNNYFSIVSDNILIKQLGV